MIIAKETLREGRNDFNRSKNGLFLSTTDKEIPNAREWGTISGPTGGMPPSTGTSAGESGR